MTSILKTDEIQSQNGGSVVKMQTLKHPSASGNNITLDGSNNVSLGGTLSAGTIGDNVVHQSAKYYLNLEAPGSQYGEFDDDSDSDYGMFNNSGTTRPYFATGVGDTTNIVAVNNHDYKLVKAGIYIINFSANFYESHNQSERSLGCQIRHNASSPTSTEGTDVLGQGRCMLASLADGHYASATAHVVYNFSENHLINFRIYESVSGFFDSAFASICLIRPI